MLAFLEKAERRRFQFSEHPLVTEEAYHTLRAWHMSPGEIQELQGIVGQFDGAYKHCSAKVAAITTVYVGETPYGRRTFLLPHIHEGMSTGIGGSCRVISEYLAKQLKETEIITRLNRKNIHNPIDIYLARGNNRTHFQSEGSVHIWIALVKRLDTQLQHMIVLDPGYQELSHIKTNGYRVSPTHIKHPTGEIPPEETLSASEIVFGRRGDITVYTPNDVILGLSEDGSVSVGLGFALYGDQNIPFLHIGHENGRNSAIFCLHPETEKIAADYNFEPFDLTPAAFSEVEYMLEVAKSFQFQPQEDS